MCKCCGHKDTYVYRTINGTIYCRSCKDRNCIWCFDEPRPVVRHVKLEEADLLTAILIDLHKRLKAIEETDHKVLH